MAEALRALDAADEECAAAERAVLTAADDLIRWDDDHGPPVSRRRMILLGQAVRRSRAAVEARAAAHRAVTAWSAEEIVAAQYRTPARRPEGGAE